MKKEIRRKKTAARIAALGLSVMMAVTLFSACASDDAGSAAGSAAGESGTVNDEGEPDGVSRTAVSADGAGGEIEVSASPVVNEYPDGYPSERQLKKDYEEMNRALEESGLEYEGYLIELTHQAHDKSAAGEEMSTEAVPFSDGLCTADSLEDLLNDYRYNEVVRVEPNYIVSMMDAASPNDPYYQDGSQWQNDVLNVPVTWEYGLEGSSISDDDPVIVAVIDSGINYDHEDIDASHVLEGYSYVTTDTTDVKDRQGHGTFCASEIMATKDNGVGVAGIVPDVYILPLRVFGTSNSAYTSDVVAAINYAADYEGCDVISMSLGGEGNSTAQDNACQHAVNNGVLVVAAAGNDGNYTLNYPAASESVIGVGSLGTDDSHTTVSTFSQRGTTNVFCTAPGYKLTGCYYNSDTAYYRASGTSMATPEVAALGAVVKSIDRTIGQDEFKQLIIDTSTDLGTKGRDSDYGYGLVDFKAAAESLIDISGEGTVRVQVVDEDRNPVENAIVRIYAENSDTEITPEADGSYRLDRGRYTYQVKADKYEDAKGSFYVISAGRTLRITMEGLSYPATLQVQNTGGEELTGADITLKNKKNVTQKTETPGVYSLKAGVYTYSISATGYYTQTGTLTVTDDGANDFTVTLYGDRDVASAKLNVVDEDGSSVTGVDVKIYNADGGEVMPYADGYYKLYPGTYRYVAESARYLTEEEEFVITEAQKGKIITLTVPMLNPVMWVYFEVVPIYASVTVKDGTGAVVEPYAPGEYKLLKGSYTYTVTAESYKTVEDSFILTTKGMTIPIDMEDDLDDSSARVTFSSNGGTSVEAITATIGEKITAPAEPARTGYTFEGWYKEASLTTPWNFDTDVIMGRTTLYAKWKASQYRIVYLFRDQEIEGLSPSVRSYGTPVTKLPVPQIDGWHFEHWCSDVDLKNEITSIPGTKTGDVYLYAFCTEDTGEYPVHFETNGGSAVADYTATEANGWKVVPASEPQKTGYTFAGWYRDPALTEAWDLENDAVTWEMTLYAAYTANTYQITYMDGAQTLTGLEPAEYTYNVPVMALPVPEKSGQRFAGWYKDAGLKIPARGIPAGSTGDLTLYAKWDDGTVTVPDDCDYEPDENGNYPAVSEDGYTLIYDQSQLEAIGDQLYTSTEAQNLTEAEKPKYRLACSIMLSGDWTPLGSNGRFFAGYFDGAGHTIAGLSISAAASKQSLFGCTHHASIENLTVYGNVTGTSFTAGVASECYQSDFTNIQSHVNVTVTEGGKNAGGIVCSLYGGTISRCVNYGTVVCGGKITSPTCIYATGGILGDTGISTSVTKIDNCVNYGEVWNGTGTPTGGIVGYMQAAGDAVTNCYNIGTVSQTGTDATLHTYGTAAGIAGLFKGGSLLSGCYNAGTVVSEKAVYGHREGDGYDYLTAAVAFYNTTSVNYKDCYFLNGSSASDVAIGRIVTESSVPGYVWYYTVSADGGFTYAGDLNYDDVIEGLGDAYTKDADGALNGGYPALLWQIDPTGELAFLLTDEMTGRPVLDAEVYVDDALLDGAEAVVAPGRHSYRVVRDGYEPVSSSVFFGGSDTVISLKLAPLTFAYTISVTPKDAALTLSNRLTGQIEAESVEEQEDRSIYTFILPSSRAHGKYTVAVSKYGYDMAEDSLTVNEAGEKAYVLEGSEYQNLNFEIYPEDADAAVTVTNAAGDTIEPYQGTLYHITAGTVSYEIRAKGYQTVRGTVTVPGNVTNVSVVLEQSTGWSGETDTSWYEPDETDYVISTAEELAGVAEICNDKTNTETFAGKTIRLEEDIHLNNLEWTPVGIYAYGTVDGFSGTFDGQGHVIDGLYINREKSETGLFSRTLNAKICNLTVYGSVTGREYTGGIAGSARGTEFRDIDVHVDVTTDRYQIGGIAGVANTSPGSFIRCRNFGTIRSTGTKWTGTQSYAIGGIVGAVSTSGGSADKGTRIEGCVNKGTVTAGMQSVGGVAGYIGTVSGAQYASVVNSYNSGTVENTYAGGYSGGVVGRVYGTYADVTMQNCLNFGPVKNAEAGFDCGMVGFSNGKLTADNCWYSYDSASSAVSASAEYAGVTVFGSEADNGYEAVVDKLGNAYRMAGTEGTPILTWEESTSEYEVTFAVSYDVNDNLSDEYRVNYIVTGRDADGMDTEFTVSDGKAYLPKGVYAYTVSRTGYETETGTFRVDSEETAVPVTLHAVKYALRITAEPAAASVVLKNEKGAVISPASAENGVFTFHVTNGAYAYTAQQYEYETENGEAQIAFSDAEQNITLKLLPKYQTGFALQPDEGELPDDWTVTVYSGGSPVASAGMGDILALPKGDYTYAARAKGYDTKRGEFTVTANGTVSIAMQKKQAGITIADTDWYYDNEDSDQYEIGTAEELRGFEKLVNENGIDFAGKTVWVTDNIDISDTKWQPVGSWSGTHFKGTFDGGGHVITINNGTMSGSERAFGLFGCLEGAKVSDLILRGSIRVSATSSSATAAVIYAGGLAGYSTASTIERVSNQMVIDMDVAFAGTGVIDAGGLIGWAGSGTVESCSNIGGLSVSVRSQGADGTHAIAYGGGIVGYVNATSASAPFTITNCYNTGTIEAESSYMSNAAGIAGVINSYNSFSMKNCYNSGIIRGQKAAALATNDTISGTVANNYYREDMTSVFGHAQTDEEMRAQAFAVSLGAAYEATDGGYPKLTWESTVSAVAVETMPEKTAYNDLEDFDDTGLTLKVTYADGSSETVVSGWRVLDGEALRVDRDGKAADSTAAVNVSVEFRGYTVQVPVQVTQVAHVIGNDLLALEIPAPEAGAEAESFRIEADTYTADISWTCEGEDFTGTFEEGKFYRAKAVLTADYETGRIWNVFTNSSTPAADGAIECRDKTVTADENGARTVLTAYFTYPATGTAAESLEQRALHLYYAGDVSGDTDYRKLLEQKVTVSDRASGASKAYTLREIEERILADGQLQTQYTGYANGLYTKTLTGISLYDLCMDSGLFAANLSGASEVTINGTAFSWDMIRRTGASYDAENNAIRTDLPALLTVAEANRPLSARNLFGTAVPMQDFLDDETAYWLQGVSQIELTDAQFLNKYQGTFLVTAKGGEDISDLIRITVTDAYGRTVAPQPDGTYALNENETYTWQAAAKGYGTATGEIDAVTGDQLITAELLPTWDGETYSEPEQDEEGYYLIYNADELMWFNKNAGANTNARLMKDITLNQAGDYTNRWEPMFTSETGSGYYMGTFDGNGHTIYGMYIALENEYELGLVLGDAVVYSRRTDVAGMFGYLGGTVKDLSVQGRYDITDRPDSTLASWFQLGGIAGFLKGTVSGVHTDIEISYRTGTETTYVGGYPERGFPEYCDTYIGGIAGSMTGSASIENCYTTGDISGTGTRSVCAGGIAGGMRSSNASISYCYSAGDIQAAPGSDYSSAFDTELGGILGRAGVTGTTGGEISYCFALNRTIDGIAPLDDSDRRVIRANRIIGQTASGTTLKYNYANESMEIRNVNEQDTGDYSRNGVNGGNVSLTAAQESMNPFTGIGWSEDIWKSASAKTLPVFYWQQTGESVSTYPVTILASDGADIIVTGGMDENGQTTSASTITFTADMKDGAAGELLSVSCTGGTLKNAKNYYSISDITGPVVITVAAGVPGDITGDGVTDHRDAAMARRYAAGKMEADTLQIIIGDVDRDGALTAQDADLIAQYSTGLIDRFAE